MASEAEGPQALQGSSSEGEAPPKLVGESTDRGTDVLVTSEEDDAARLTPHWDVKGMERKAHFVD